MTMAQTRYDRKKISLFGVRALLGIEGVGAERKCLFLILMLHLPDGTDIYPVDENLR